MAPSAGLLDGGDPAILDVRTRAAGPPGKLPLTDAVLRAAPSGDIFGLTQDVGMGWSAARLGGPEVLVLSTQGGLRDRDGAPVALGLHTGHWEVGLLVEEAAREIARGGGVPFAVACSDPCDGRTQGTSGMLDSLPYRNDAATIFRRLIRSLPTRRAAIGIATCDKGLPAMMMALAGQRDLPCVLVPGGVTLPAADGEDAGTVQSLGARYVHGLVTLDEAAELGCRACASPGGGCQFLGTAATAQVVGEALGLALPHTALAPSGQPIWRDAARRSAAAARAMIDSGVTTSAIVTDAAIRNAMVVHAAFGGSTNLLIHLPAIAHAAGLRRPAIGDWEACNRAVPRLVDALPNGPRNHPTVQVFLAGGVPEVMLQLRALGLLDLEARSVAGLSLGDVLAWWEGSERRRALRGLLRDRDGVDPNDVILSPRRARERGIGSTVCFPRGNLAPEGAVVKSTAIDGRALSGDGRYDRTLHARVFTTERAAIAAIKSTGTDRVAAGDVVVLICRGPIGAGMEEVYQVTAALRHLPWGHDVAVITDARFSGVSTGACIGHVSPEALAGGPIGKVLDGDLVRIAIDRQALSGSIDLVGEGGRELGAIEGTRLLAARALRPDLVSDPELPSDTRLWAALQESGGGAWGGCVVDVDVAVAKLRGRR
ncbi:MAG: YjhG/YagF family D-xylonate dehydratase [Acidobacteriota bacterium]